MPSWASKYLRTYLEKIVDQTQLKKWLTDEANLFIPEQQVILARGGSDVEGEVKQAFINQLARNAIRTIQTKTPVQVATESAYEEAVNDKRRRD